MATMVSPYSHPSLGLGNIAQPLVIAQLDKIKGHEAAINASQERLNTVIACKQSMNMTQGELSALGVDTSSIDKKIKELDTEISKAATNYIDIKIKNETEIQTVKEELNKLTQALMPESPIAFDQSQLQSFPLYSESIQLDSRFFSFNGNLQQDKLANVEKFIRSSTSNLASKSKELSQAACEQINSQISDHKICGTLVITASCTHRNAQLFTPLVIDPNKAVIVWNSLKEDKIDTSNEVSVAQALSEKQEKGSDNTIPLITGAVYGSSFIGMVHLLKLEENSLGDLDKLKKQLEKKIKAGGWLANVTGKIGTDPKIESEIRAFLSSNSMSCHVSILSMGAIPTIKSNETELSISRLAQVPDEQIAALKQPPQTSTISSESEIARQNELSNTLRNTRIEHILKTITTTDTMKNNCLDMNTLVTALDNYLEAVRSKDNGVGIPIGFFIHRMTRSEIACLWLKKHFPDKDELKTAN